MGAAQEKEKTDCVHNEEDVSNANSFVDNNNKEPSKVVIEDNNPKQVKED